MISRPNSYLQTSTVAFSPMNSYFARLQFVQQALQFSQLASTLRQPPILPLMPLLKKSEMKQTLQFPTLSAFPDIPLGIFGAVQPQRNAVNGHQTGNRSYGRGTGESKGNVKKYRCDICEKTFSRSNTLLTHRVNCFHLPSIFYATILIFFEENRNFYLNPEVSCVQPESILSIFSISFKAYAMSFNDAV